MTNITNLYEKIRENISSFINTAYNTNDEAFNHQRDQFLLRDANSPIFKKPFYELIKRYKVTAQPYYRMLGPNGEDLDNGSADYMNHKDPKDFEAWIDEGLKLYKEIK